MQLRGFLFQLLLPRRIGLDFDLLFDHQHRQCSQIASSEPQVGDGIAIAGFTGLFPQAFA
jgi:hypothetical protein